MINNIEEYLNTLREELAGSDPATIQDALSDAEEHLRSSVETNKQEQPEISEAEALAMSIEAYGPPDEVASAYGQIETYIQPALAHTSHPNGRSFWARLFGVFAEPRAWGALLYMLLSLVTGIIYFTWAVTGISLSAGFIILIIG